MRLRSLGGTTMILLTAWSAGGCGHDASPTAPTMSAALAATDPSPAPAPTSVTLTGRVTEAPPTSSTGVWDATVTLDDGTNSWRSEKTIGGVGYGRYTIAGVRPGRFRATVSADGFLGVSQDVTIAADTTLDFRLLPVAVTKTLTVGGELKSGDGTCSDGTTLKPCHIIAIPIHNAGPIDATLTWRCPSPVSLNLTLFEKGRPAPLAKASSAGATNERITATLSGGAVYELRITYSSGTAASSYSLSVSYPN